MQGVSIRQKEPAYPIKFHEDMEPDSIGLPTNYEDGENVCEGFYLSKARCYNCGKVFKQGMVDKYQEFLRSGSAEPYKLVQPNDDTPYENKLKNFLQKDLGLVRLCCRMHFMTPYQISRGAGIGMQGLVNQRNADRKLREEIKAMNDPLGEIVGGARLNIMKTHKGKLTTFEDKTKVPSSFLQTGEKIGVLGKQEARMLEKREQIQRDTTLNLDQILETYMEIGEIPDIEDEDVDMEEEDPYDSVQANQGRLNYFTVVPQDPGAKKSRKK